MPKALQSFTHAAGNREFVKGHVYELDDPAVIQCPELFDFSDHSVKERRHLTANPPDGTVIEAKAPDEPKDS